MLLIFGRGFVAFTDPVQFYPQTLFLAEAKKDGSDDRMKTEVEQDVDTCPQDPSTCVEAWMSHWTARSTLPQRPAHRHRVTDHNHGYRAWTALGWPTDITALCFACDEPVRVAGRAAATPADATIFATLAQTPEEIDWRRNWCSHGARDGMPLIALLKPPWRRTSSGWQSMCWPPFPKLFPRVASDDWTSSDLRPDQIQAQRQRADQPPGPPLTPRVRPSVIPPSAPACDPPATVEDSQRASADDPSDTVDEWRDGHEHILDELHGRRKRSVVPSIVTLATFTVFCRTIAKLQKASSSLT